MIRKTRYPISNAGTIFASVIDAEWGPAFQYTVTLNEWVDDRVLAQALDRTLDRFPYFNVCLKSGFFRFYFEKREEKVTPERRSRFDVSAGTAEPLLRVLYDDREISLVVVHVLCDGAGALTFFKTLLAQYFSIKGLDVPLSQGIFDIRAEPEPEEFEDSYTRFSRKTSEPLKKEQVAYHAEAAALAQISAATGVMDTAEVVCAAHKRGVSVTEYFSAILLEALHRLQRGKGSKRFKPVKLCVTADLRKFYPSKTLRIFSAFGLLGIEPDTREISFEELARQVYHQSRTVFTERALNAYISKNVGFENSHLMRIVPLFIKKAVISWVYRWLGQNRHSLNLTNMGSVQMPEAFADRVERFETMGFNLRYNKLECGIASCQGKLTICMTRSIDEPFLEEYLFHKLEEDGISVAVTKSPAAESLRAALKHPQPQPSCT